jgi:hypothetical protein
VHIRSLFPIAGVVTLSVASCLAQNPTPPSAPTLTPVDPPPEMPAKPTVDPIRSMPAYGQQQAQPDTAPTPTSATQPVPPPPAQTATAADSTMPGYAASKTPVEDRKPNSAGSTYIPVDSWVYPSMTRLYSLGYVDTMFLGMRPWTRQSVMHMLDESDDAIRDSDSDEAKEILSVMKRELQAEVPDASGHRSTVFGTESIYTRLMGISGNTLRDSYHLGQTLVNDYGRPYAPGFNGLLGASTVAEYGRFSLYFRGEYQHAPGYLGYSDDVGRQLATVVDQSPNSGGNLVIPVGQIASQNPFRLVEATLSFHLLGHEISGGKSDAWLGPAQGGALAWSNNAENIYSFRINRVEPLHIPYLSALLGPLRYDFFYGSLKGHTDPNHPYTDSAMFSFRPTKNFEFGFQRTIVFGGAGHSPVTFHTFIKSFFDLNDVTPDRKLSRDDPGARFSDFNASYRLPFLRKYATFYVDSIAHDDVTPISAPRRAAYRTGIYLSQIPGMRKLDFRVEGVSTDPKTSRSSNGEFNYWELIQRQAYTNKGLIFGDWIGREAKGGQAWLTYHLSGNEWIQAEYLNKKNDKDFAGGTTQNQFKASVVKRFYHDNLELNAWFQYEKWKAPIYLQGPQSNTTTSFQLTYFPGLRSRPVQ